jgi:hypothetical protein
LPTEDETRRELFDLLEAAISSRGAALLMTYLPPTGWANLATKDEVRALGAELRGEISSMRSELKGDIAELRGELKADIGALDSKIGVLSGQAGVLQEQLRSQIARMVAANVATIVGLAGFGYGAAALIR